MTLLPIMTSQQPLSVATPVTHPIYKWEMSDHSHLGAFFFLEIYSGLLHLTPLIYQEWLLHKKTKEKCERAFVFLEIHLAGLYLASAHPHLRQIVLAGKRTDQPRSVHFPCLRIAVHSKISQHSLPQPGEYEAIPIGHAGVRERGRREGMEIHREGPEKYDDSFVIYLSSSKSLCSYALEPHLSSARNLDWSW